MALRATDVSSLKQNKSNWERSRGLVSSNDAKGLWKAQRVNLLTASKYPSNKQAALLLLQNISDRLLSPQILNDYRFKVQADNSGDLREDWQFIWELSYSHNGPGTIQEARSLWHYFVQGELDSRGRCNSEAGSDPGLHSKRPPASPFLNVLDISWIAPIQAWSGPTFRISSTTSVCTRPLTGSPLTWVIRSPSRRPASLAGPPSSTCCGRIRGKCFTWRCAGTVDWIGLGVYLVQYFTWQGPHGYVLCGNLLPYPVSSFSPTIQNWIKPQSTGLMLPPHTFTPIKYNNFGHPWFRYQNMPG